MPQPGQPIEVLWVEIAARTDQLVTDAQKAVDQVVKKLDQIDDKVEETESTFSRLGNFIKTSFSIAAGIGLANVGFKLVQGIKDFGKAMIDTNAQMQTYEQSFKVLTGSAEEAGEIIEWVKEQAKATPFDVPGLINASQMLMTWGLDLKEWFTVVGDVAAGMNRPLSQVVNAIGTLATGQTGEAVRRFRDLGINLREFSDQLEFDAQGSLVTPLEEAIPIVRQIMIDKFGGMMEAQSKTWAGVMSNMADTWEQFVQVVGEPIFETLNEQLSSLYQWVEENGEAIESFARDLGRLLGTALDALLDLGKALGSVLGQIDEIFQRISGQGIIGTMEQGVKNLRAITGGVAGGLRGGADLLGGLLGGESIQEAMKGAAEATSETMTIIGGFGDEAQEAAEKQRELTDAQLAGVEAVRALGDAYKDLSDEEVLEKTEQSAAVEVTASAMDAIANLGLISQDTADAYRELTADVRENAAAFREGVQEYEATAAAAEEAAAAMEKLRQEQEANLVLAQEVGAKLTDKLTDAMEKYEATITKLTQETAEAIAEIEADAAAAEAQAIKRNQDQMAQLREDFAREQLRRRRRFNLEWARLIRDQNQEVIDAEWEYEYQKQNLLLEGDENALAELEARYAHEKDVRSREQQDTRDDTQQRYELENIERQEQFERSLRELEERLQQEIENIREKAAEEVEAKKAALEERLAHEDQALEERLAKIGEQLAKEVGDNQTATEIILRAWQQMYGNQVTEAINTGVIVRREMDAIIQRAIQAASAVANVRLGRGQPPAWDPDRPASVGLQHGGYTPGVVAPVTTHPGEYMLNPATTAALESAAGGPLTQQTVRSMAESRRRLDVFVDGTGAPADVIRRIERQLIDALKEDRTEF